MQKHINKIVLFLIFFSYSLYGCALCTVYSPETQVSLEIKADDKRIKTANITWVLSREFSDQLKEIYDQNQDNNILKDELIPIEESIVDYVKEKNYLVHISYDKIINQKKSKKVIIKSKKTYMKNGLLHFNYLLNLDYEIKKDNVLYVNIEDDENYFILLLAKNGIKFDAPFKTEQVLNKQSVAFYTNSSTIINLEEKIQKEKIENLENLENLVNTDVTKDNKELKKKEEVKKEETYLQSFSKKVKEYLVKIENGDDYALFILLGISFIYGIIHALGPGHGKSLAFSYFASNKSSYFKAFWISQASAFVHIIGALILVMVSVFILQSMLNNFVNDSVEILTKVSAIMIILLAIYILYNKLKNKSCACSSCCSTNTNVNPTWSVSKPNTSTNLKPNFMKKDLYFVLTAGLIPCPGTVVLFIYAFILKTYFAVILASIFISLGMGIVIFVSSFLGVSVHNLSERSHKITNALEILAPIVMFILGILLFLNADII